MKKCTFVFCLFLALLLLTACGQPAAQSQEPAENRSGAVPAQWQPTLTVEAASPTGATILFRQENPLEDCLLLSGNDYILQKKEGGIWADLPTLVEDVNWIRSAFVVTAIPRDAVDWEWLYGSLTAGDYRIGKSITLTHNNEILDTVMVYGEFTIDKETMESTEETQPAKVTLPIPASSSVTLSLSGTTLHTVTGEDAERVVALMSQVRPANGVTRILYKGLDLTFHGKDGSEVVFAMDGAGDFFLYEDVCYSYDTQSLQDIFGITDWLE